MGMDGGGTLEFTSTKSKKASLEFPKVAKEPSSDFGRLNGFLHECINLTMFENNLNIAS